MDSLSRVLSENRNAILARWIAGVRTELGIEALSVPEMVDHVPIFIDAIAVKLRSPAAPTQANPAAEEHGVNRLRLGFSIGGVVKEYRVLHHCILAEAQAQGVDVKVWEVSALTDCITDGIEDAISQYTRERDAELERHMNEHFAFVAHELRNPLSTARLALETLQRRNMIAEHKAAGALDRSLRQMGELIEHFLRVSQIKSRYQIQTTLVSLRALLESEIEESAPHAEDRDITLILDLAEDKQIKLDRRLIHSALDNGVRNAIKFTPPHGSVTLRARVDSGRATIEVEDCCGGISVEDVSQAFNPFVQFNADKSGFGLGLAIAKQAMDAHGGTVRIQNLPGKGCVLVLEWPVDAAA